MGHLWAIGRGCRQAPKASCPSPDAVLHPSGARCRPHLPLLDFYPVARGHLSMDVRRSWTALAREVDRLFLGVHWGGPLAVLLRPLAGADAGAPHCRLSAAR